MARGVNIVQLRWNFTVEELELYYWVLVLGSIWNGTCTTLAMLQVVKTDIPEVHI